MDIAENLGIKMLFIIDNVDNHIGTNQRKIFKCQSSSLPQNIDTKNFHQIDFHPQKKRKESLLLVPGDYHADFKTSQPH